MNETGSTIDESMREQVRSYCEHTLFPLMIRLRAVVNQRKAELAAEGPLKKPHAEQPVRRGRRRAAR